MFASIENRSMKLCFNEFTFAMFVSFITLIIFIKFHDSLDYKSYICNYSTHKVRQTSSMYKGSLLNKIHNRKLMKFRMNFLLFTSNGFHNLGKSMFFFAKKRRKVRNMKAFPVIFFLKKKNRKTYLKPHSDRNCLNLTKESYGRRVTTGELWLGGGYRQALSMKVNRVKWLCFRFVNYQNEDAFSSIM